MATSLSGKTIGTPDNAFAWYLQSGGGTLAAGFPVSLGNGTETPLWLFDNGIGVWDSRGFVMRDLYTVLATDATNSTTTDAAIGSFGLALEASATYEFEITLMVKAAVATTGVQVQLTGPTAQTTWVAYEMITPTSNTLLTTNTGRIFCSAFGVYMANLTSPVADTFFPITIRGILRTSATAPALPIGIGFKSEVASSLVTVAAGSIMRAVRIA
jgi:hypothetical protein